MKISPNHERHFRRLDNNHPIDDDCVEDRGVKPGRQNRKTVAGLFGHAQDTTAARSMNGMHVERVSDTTRLIAHLMGGKLHDDCTGENKAIPIALYIVKNGERVLKTANELAGGDHSQSDFERLQEFYAILAASTLRDPEEEAARMAEQSGEYLYPAIGRAGLLNAKHAGDVMIANGVPNTWFPSDEAYASGDPAFVLDTWALPEVARTIDSLLPLGWGGVERFCLSAVARAAATADLLSNGDGMQGLTVVRRDAA